MSIETAAPPDDLLSAEQAGALLNVTGHTIRRWHRDGLITAVRLPSGQHRYRRADIDAIRDGGDT